MSGDCEVSQAFLTIPASVLLDGRESFFHGGKEEEVTDRGKAGDLKEPGHPRWWPHDR